MRMEDHRDVSAAHGDKTGFKRVGRAGGRRGAEGARRVRRVLYARLPPTVCVLEEVVSVHDLRLRIVHRRRRPACYAANLATIRRGAQQLGWGASVCVRGTGGGAAPSVRSEEGC